MLSTIEYSRTVDFERLPRLLVQMLHKIESLEEHVKECEHHNSNLVRRLHMACVSVVNPNSTQADILETLHGVVRREEEDEEASESE